MGRRHHAETETTAEADQHSLTGIAPKRERKPREPPTPLSKAAQLKVSRRLLALVESLESEGDQQALVELARLSNSAQARVTRRVLGMLDRLTDADRRTVVGSVVALFAAAPAAPQTTEG